MSYRKRGLSVDIGNEKIKIAEYYRKKNKIKVTNTLLIDTPENSVKDGQLVDIPAISEVIKVGLKDAKIKNKHVLFTISSSKVITREVDLPDLPLKKLDTLIRMNAEEYFPVNLTEYTLDYSIVEKLVQNGENQVRVNIIAALTVLCESYIELAEALDLKISEIDYAGNSISSFAKYINEDRTFMLLDLGSDNTMVAIINQNIVRFNRNLVYGTKVITKSIQNHFGVGYKEAIKISTEQALLTNTPEGNDYLSSDVSAALNQILNGVSRLVDYYAARNKDGIEQIILVGGGTNIKGIAEYVENYFNIKTKIITSKEMTVAGSEQFIKDQVFYANTIGAVFSEINLLPDSILNKSKDKAANRLRGEVVLLVLVLGLLALYMPYASVRKLEKENATLISEKTEKEMIVPIKEAYSKQLTAVQFYRDADKYSSSVTQIMVAIFEEMEKTIPSEVDYLSMASSEQGLMISCVAPEKIDIVSLITILKELKIDDRFVFTNVYVPAISKAEVSDEMNKDDILDLDAGYYTFSISCDFATEVE